MAFQPAPNIASVAIRATYFGEPIANILHAAYDSEIGYSALNALATGVGGLWDSYMIPALNVAYVMGEVVATDLSVQDSIQAVDNSKVGVAGEVNATPGMPGNVAMCITFRTARIGRSYRGRIYLAGASEAYVAGNEFEPGWTATMGDAMRSVIAGIEVLAGWTPVVLSRYNNNSTRTSAIGTPITTVVVRDRRVDSQRLRLGRG